MNQHEESDIQFEAALSLVHRIRPGRLEGELVSMAAIRDLDAGLLRPSYDKLITAAAS